MTDENRKFTLDEIYEMLGGEDYFTNETVYFVYYSINKEYDKALHYKNICIENANQVNDKIKLLKTQQEMEILHKELKDDIKELKNDIDKL